MFNSFTEESKKLLISAKEEMKKLKHPVVGSEHLLLAILKDKNIISDRLKSFNLTYDNFKEELISIVGIGSKESTCFLYTPLLKRVMENALIDSKENNNGIVTLSHLFVSLLEEGEGVAIRILIGMEIDLDLLYQEFAYKLPVKKSKNKKLILEELGEDLTKKAITEGFDPVVGRDEEIKMVLEVLCRRKKNNPVLIGPSGVGKTAIVEEISKLIATGDVPIQLKNKRIRSLNMSSAVAGTKYRGEFEDRINKILKELEDNDNIILFIDEIHTLVGAGGAEGAIDASNIFKPALARNKIRCIGATTTDEFKKFIEKDKALERRFQKIFIEEPDDLNTKKILLKLSSVYSNFHKINIKDEVIDYIIEMSNKYIHNRYQPDKSIDILDEACAYVNIGENKNLKRYNELNKKLTDLIKKKKECILRCDYKSASIYKLDENKLMSKLNKLDLTISSNNNFKELTRKDVINIISRKTQIPLYQFKDYNDKEIINIEKKLKRAIIGHDENIDKLINVYKKLHLGFKDDNSCYSMMFVGPSGVGKTMLAKLFGKSLTKNILKLDMSEFSESHSISKLLGSPAGYVGYDDNKNLLESIKNNPFSFVILDEIEKAHPNIINLLYQILDEGYVRDSKGDMIYFNNCIIVMTSNIGYDKYKIGFNNNTASLSALKDTFSLPFINRIDDIIPFDFLSPDIIRKIINDKITELKRKYLNKGIKVTISKNVIEELIDICDYESFGARKINKLIKSRLEGEIINKYISGINSINIRTLKKEKVFN